MDENKPAKTVVYARRAFLLTLAAGGGWLAFRKFFTPGVTPPQAPAQTAAPGLAAGTVWTKALAALGAERARALEVLAGDILPPEPLQLKPAVVETVLQAELARVRMWLDEEHGLEFHRRGLDALRDRLKRPWHAAPWAQRAAALDELFAVEPEHAPGELALPAEYVAIVRNELEENFWRMPPVVLRLTSLAAGTAS